MKCASSTIRQLLYDNTDENLVFTTTNRLIDLTYTERFDQSGRRINLYRSNNLDENIDWHVWPRQLKTFFDMKGWNWNDYYKFTTVRNPWAKLVSAFYFQMAKLNNTSKNDYKPQFDVMFEKFRQTILNRNFTALKFEFEDYVSDVSGELLIDDTFKVENLNDDIHIIFEKIGIPVKFDSVPIINTTHHSPYREYYDEETKNIVGKYFQNEIKKFNYEF